MMRLWRTCGQLGLATIIGLWATAAAGGQTADGQSADAPCDEFFVLDSRPLGGQCRFPSEGEFALRQRTHGDLCCSASMQRMPLDVLWAAPPGVVNLVFVHGNRIDAGDALERGLIVYRSLRQCLPETVCVRLIVFSWPSAQIRGGLRDVRVKAQRSDAAALHLGWLLNRFPADAHLALVGYSYGARVVGGALQLTQGGMFLGRRLPAVVERIPPRVAYIAAAVDRDWILPGRPHGLAASGAASWLLINNSVDPAMKYYHVTRKGARPEALGEFGIPRNWPFASSVRQLQVARQVGKEHNLPLYMSTPVVRQSMIDTLIQGESASLAVVSGEE